MQRKKEGPLAQWLRRNIRDKRGARATVKCTLTNDWVIENSYTDRCAVTGLPLLLGRPGDPCSPSFDRIDPSKPYTPDNTRVISLFANVAKNQWSEEVFRLLVLATAANMGRL